MPKKQSKYMDANAFWENFRCIANDAKAFDAIANILSEDAVYRRLDLDMSPISAMELNELIDKYQDAFVDSFKGVELATQILASLADPRPEAKEFLTRAKTNTAIYMMKSSDSKKTPLKNVEHSMQPAHKKRRTRRALAKRDRRIHRLENKITKLHLKDAALKSQNDFMLATIKTFIKTAEERAKASALNKGNDLAAQIAQLKKNLKIEL